MSGRGGEVAAGGALDARHPSGVAWRGPRCVGGAGGFRGQILATPRSRVHGHHPVLHTGQRADWSPTTKDNANTSLTSPCCHYCGIGRRTHPASLL